MRHTTPRTGPALLPVLVVLLMLVVGQVAAAGEEIHWETLGKLERAASKWLEEQGEGTENEFGKKTARGRFSRHFEKQEDGTYQVTAHVEHAGHEAKKTQRYLLTLSQADGKWSVSDAELKDIFVGMFRPTSARCASFDSMSFEREGIRLKGGAGQACAAFYQGRVSYIAVRADGMTYKFEPPEHATALHMIPDLHSLSDRIEKDHERELEFTPAGYIFSCDFDSCDEILAGSFVGLELGEPPPARSDGGTGDYDVGTPPGWAGPLFDQAVKERRENPFAHFTLPPWPGNRYWSVFVLRELSPFSYPGVEAGVSDVPFSLPGSGVDLTYNNWGGYEMTFNAWPRRLDVPDQLFLTVYGYYTEETIRNTPPYEIERREDLSARWHHVTSVSGSVDLGTDDPEMLTADLEFGIELKQPLRVLPFAIASVPRRDFTGNNKARELFVNAVQLDGEELTWTQTSQFGGLVVLPEEMPAGTELKLRMLFDTRALVKWTASFTEVSRFGWMPFVSFGDFIDDFELTLRAPSDYKVLGIGRKVSEKQEGDETVTHWVADSPVVFPSITFGRYQADTPGDKFELPTRHDGTEIPVTVHVDKASFVDWGIAPKSLRPIAQQAVNAINLYTEISGLDYPYGELNFVNDPQGFLYGQAPSSLIYLGSGVFRGEGFLATLPFFPDATSISKFLKSVTAHEVGHQWWGSRVSNANDRNYWFVETLAEYFSAIYLELVHGPKAYEEQVDEWRRTILDETNLASVQNASSLWSDGSYQALVYNKGPMAFHMLRQIFGDEKFFAALKEFSQDLAEKREIVTLDIQQAAEKSLGGVDPETGQRYTVDLGWFFDQWIRSTAVPQYKLDYDVRRTEDGNWLIEGVIRQRLVMGSKWENSPVEGQTFRGLVGVLVNAGGQKYAQKLLVEGPETPFQLKVPDKPVEVELNANHSTLAHDAVVNQPW